MKLASLRDAVYAQDQVEVNRLLWNFPIKNAAPEELVELLRATNPVRDFDRRRQVARRVHVELLRTFSEHEVSLLVGEWL